MHIIDRVPEVHSKYLNELSRGYDEAQILFTAVEYDIFSLLEEQKSAEEISREIKTDLKLTEKFLNVLTALNLLHKTGNRYSNTKLTETFLVERSTFYQGNLLRMKMRRSSDWINIKEALKSGGMKIEKDAEDYIDRIFIVGHAEAAICGPIQRAVHMVSTLSEFKNAKRLLDLGGGHGLYAIAFTQLNPNLETILFDLPHVTEMAGEYFRQYDMQDKIKIIAGNFTNDDIGNEYDIVFASDVTIDEILGKVHNALSNDGVLVYRRWTLNDDRTSPLTSVLFDFMLAMMRSEHYVHTLSEYIALLKESGFTIARIMDISTQQDPTKIIVAKK